MVIAESSRAGPLQSLNREFLRLYPVESARALESLTAEESAGLLEDLPVAVTAAVIEKLNPAIAEKLILELPAGTLRKLFEVMSIRSCMAVLGRLAADEAQRVLQSLSERMRSELGELLEYPQDMAGRLMNPRVAVINEAAKVEEATQQLQRKLLPRNRMLYLISDDQHLVAQVATIDLMFADAGTSLKSLSKPVTHFVLDMDHREEVLQKLESTRVESLPVLDSALHVVGMIEGLGLIDALKADIGVDMQIMVGASKDERALSSVGFAVRKRLPWLQINLLTAFLAAFVVGIFENTIAQFTALAVLMPVVAGQSGNAGAQALAVTMRGLTLREISTRDWFKVLRKEFASGLANGCGVALVCSVSVYFWSRSMGLALVMVLAMIVSMVVAGVSGALVPVLLKRFGLDPAQSSSIVLTTVTDIAGFVSFLGIATLLAALI